MPSTARRPTWWTRAQALTWITTRRLGAANSTVEGVTPWADGDPQAAHPMLGVVQDTMQRMQAAPAALKLPTLANAAVLLEDAERAGLTADASGRFRRSEIRKRWPSPYGRGGGVAPRPWERHIVHLLAAKLVKGRRDMTRGELREWVEQNIRDRNAEARSEGRRPEINIGFQDPERWTAYVRRAAALALCDVRRRRRRCSNDCGTGQCSLESGRRLCLTREEGDAMSANVRSWIADGPLPSKK